MNSSENQVCIESNNNASKNKVRGGEPPWALFFDWLIDDIQLCGKGFCTLKLWLFSCGEAVFYGHNDHQNRQAQAPAAQHIRWKMDAHINAAQADEHQRDAQQDCQHIGRPPIFHIFSH